MSLIALCCYLLNYLFIYLFIYFKWLIINFSLDQQRDLGSIPVNGPIELFIVSANAPHVSGNRETYLGLRVVIRGC